MGGEIEREKGEREGETEGERERGERDRERDGCANLYEMIVH